MNIDKEREAFEKWITQDDLAEYFAIPNLERDAEGAYVTPMIFGALLAFRAGVSLARGDQQRQTNMADVRLEQVAIEVACEAINKLHQIGKRRFRADMTAVVRAVIPVVKTHLAIHFVPRETVEQAAPTLRFAANVVELYDDATMKDGHMIDSDECADILRALAGYRASIPASPCGVREADALASGDLCELLPGPYYMDPPDGGDLPLLEQLRRMAKDAARYRWLRNEAIHYENQDTRTPWVFNAKNVADYDGWPVWDKELDKLVDAALVDFHRIEQARKAG